MTPAGDGAAPRIPGPPVRAAAAAAALAAGAAATTALAPEPRPPIVLRGPEADAAEPIPVAEPDGAAALAPVVAGLSSEDPIVRRESAGVIERVARVRDAQVRVALAAALRRDGRRNARLALLLLSADEDPRVRRLARDPGPAR